MRNCFTIPLMVFALGCGATINGRSFDDRGRLEQAGFQVRETGGGWVRLTSPEGYSFILPTIPDFEEDSLRFGSAQLPVRSFDTMSEVNSRGFHVRIFDSRGLSAQSQERLRTEATPLFVPANGEVRSQRRLQHDGIEIEVTNILGFGAVGQHVGVLHSFVEEGFVWFLLAIYEEGYGGPGDASEFFARSLYPPPQRSN